MLNYTVTVDDVHQVFKDRTSYHCDMGEEAWTINNGEAESLLKSVAEDINQAIKTAIAQVLEDACEEKIDEMVVDNFEEQEEQDRRKEWDERKA